MPSSISKTYRKQAVVVNGGYVTVRTLPWMLSLGESTVRTTLELRALAGNFGCRVGFRSADVRTTLPNAWSTSAVGTARTSNGDYVEDVDVSGLISNAMWLQPRIEARLTSGSSVAEALAAMRIAAKRKGVVTGTQSILLQASTNNSESAYIPVGRPMSALDVDAMMFAFSLTGLAGTLGYAPVYRTFDSSAFLSPSAWSSDLATYSSITADEDRNSGILTVTPGTKGLVQAGVRITGTDIRGSLRVAVATRFS